MATKTWRKYEPTDATTWPEVSGTDVFTWHRDVPGGPWVPSITWANRGADYEYPIDEHGAEWYAPDVACAVEVLWRHLDDDDRLPA